MSHRLKFEDRNALCDAYARLTDEPWVGSCTVDLPELALTVDVERSGDLPAQAALWMRRARRRAKQQS